MKIILLQNTIISGDRFVAGQFADVPEALAKKYAEAGLAHIEQEVIPEAVKTHQEAPKEASEVVQEGIQMEAPEEAFDPVFDALDETEEATEEPQPEPVKERKKTTRSRKTVAK